MTCLIRKHIRCKPIFFANRTNFNHCETLVAEIVSFIGLVSNCAVLQYRAGSVHGSATAAASVVALGTPAAGLHPRPAREKGFPSNLLLD